MVSGRAGVKLAASPEGWSLSKVVLILVTDNVALKEVLFAPDGVLSGSSEKPRSGHDDR
jgi:3-hydroxyisobutyrate dehydrogenase-like beta-hydroxyacid dehydrogenase